MSPWSLKRISCFPITLGIVLATGLIVTYIIAVSRKDVSPYMPFISEAGAYQPEGGIFSLFLYISSTLGLVTLALRYMVVDEFNRAVDRSMDILNKISLAIGVASMAGMIVVAAYPMITIRLAHNIGAYTLFVGGLFYGSCQTWVSYKMCPYYNGKAICRIRLILTLIGGLTLIIMIIFTPIANYLWNSGSHAHWKGSKTPKDEGFDFLLVSSISEWLMALLFLLYYFTFIREFQKVSIHVTMQLLVNHFDENPPHDSAEQSERNPLIT